MSKILVSGLINFEITLQVDKFPINYFPINYSFFGVNNSVSGVGFNIAKSLTILGNEIKFLSMIGKDNISGIIKNALKSNNISDKYIIENIEQTPQSVILFDKTGRRQIFLDLKNIQNIEYPEKNFNEVLNDCDIALLCNINFSRKFLKPAKAMKKIIATDVHTISNLDDDYNNDFMKYADILFMSNESLPCSPVEWINSVKKKFGNEIIVIGLGSEGALISIKSMNIIEKLNAVHRKKILNTIGAGDALFSSFIHFYMKTRNPMESIKKAMIFAAWKISGCGGSDSFLSEEELNRIYNEI